VISNRTKRTQNRVNAALRVAAQSLDRSHSALGGFCQRMKAKHGTAEACVTIAHRLDRVISNLRRKAALLGFELAPAPS
jgi:transposase